MQGLPWKYTWKELKPLFEDCGPIARADVMFGRDGRSRVIMGVGNLCAPVSHLMQTLSGRCSLFAHMGTGAARGGPSLLW